MRNKTHVVFLIAILLVATWLRFHKLDAQSFWNDEGNSARLSERSLRLIIEGTASDIHPPLYYVALRGWRALVGESEFGLRSLSAFAGVVVVALTARFGWLVFGPVVSGTNGRNHTFIWASVIATFIVALNPAHIYYSQEARMYTLLPLWAVAGTVLLLEREKGKGEKGKVGYVLVMAAGLYTHYFFPIVIIVHGLHVLIERQWRRWLLLIGASLLLYTPWIPFFLNGLGGNRGMEQPLPAYVDNVLRFLIYGAAEVAFFPPTQWTLVWLAFAIGIVGFWLILQTRYSIFLLLWLFLPLLALPALGATDVAFFKFLLFCTPAIAIMCGAALTKNELIIERITSPRHNRVSNWSKVIAMRLLNITAVAFILTLITLSPIADIYAEPSWQRDDYRGMAGRIAEENHPNAGIILNAPNQWEVFTYYHREGAPVYPLPIVQDESAVLAELTAIADQHDRIYTLYWGDQQQDPNRWVESWLDANTFKTTEEWVGDVRFVTYAVPDAPATEPDHELAVVFGEQIRLNGYALNSDTVRAGDVLQVTLFWEAVAPIDRRYKVFVHLLDANGVLVAQNDREPDIFTNDWQVGDAVQGNYGVLITGEEIADPMQLLVGWYDVANPALRLVTDSNADALILMTVALTPK